MHEPSTQDLRGRRSEWQVRSLPRSSIKRRQQRLKMRFQTLDHRMRQLQRPEISQNLSSAKQIGRLTKAFYFNVASKYLRQQLLQFCLPQNFQGHSTTDK
jgi:hypothetical protein